MKKGLFITIEGPDGAGKTTIQKCLQQEFQKKGIMFHTTREPGGIEIAEQIREVILSPNNIKMDARTEALLYAAARRQHLVEKVIPILKSGEHVLCDRFLDSSLAYQGFARGLGMEEVMSINRFAIEGVMPDITIFLMLDPAEGKRRINVKRSNEKIDRLDLEELEFHKQVYKGYEIIAKMDSARITVIDASQPFCKVLQETIQILRKKIKNLKGATP